MLLTPIVACTPHMLHGYPTLQKSHSIDMDTWTHGIMHAGVASKAHIISIMGPNLLCDQHGLAYDKHVVTNHVWSTSEHMIKVGSFMLTHAMDHMHVRLHVQGIILYPKNPYITRWQLVCQTQRKLCHAVACMDRPYWSTWEDHAGPHGQTMLGAARMNAPRCIQKMSTSCQMHIRFICYCFSLCQLIGT